VGDDRKEFRLSVQDDRKRPDLSGTQFPVVPEAKKPARHQETSDPKAPRGSVPGAEPDQAPSKGLSAGEQFQILQKEWERISATAKKSLSEAKSDKLKQQIFDEFRRSRHDYVIRHLKFAEQHPKEEVAVKALHFVFLFSDAESEQRSRAKTLVLQDHLEKKNLAVICRVYGSGFDDDWKKLLEGVAAKNPHREPRAHALLALGLERQRVSESGSDQKPGREAAKFFEEIIAKYADIKDLNREEKLGEIAGR